MTADPLPFLGYPDVVQAASAAGGLKSQQLHTGVGECRQQGALLVPMRDSIQLAGSLEDRVDVISDLLARREAVPTLWRDADFLEVPRLADVEDQNAVP